MNQNVARLIYVLEILVPFEKQTEFPSEPYPKMNIACTLGTSGEKMLDTREKVGAAEEAVEFQILVFTVITAVTIAEVIQQKNLQKCLEIVEIDIPTRP